jgi:1-acyl-sn-glycerol-3-phosphate acyltransferase
MIILLFGVGHANSSILSRAGMLAGGSVWNDVDNAGTMSPSRRIRETYDNDSIHMTLRNRLNTLIYACRWLWIGLATIVSICYIEARTAFTPRRIRPDRYARLARLWGRLFLLGVRCSLEGAHHVPRDRAVIFASNHQSAFDIPLFHALMPVTFRWMSKRHFFSWPFIGRALRSMRAIGVYPGSHTEVRRSRREAVEALMSGHNLVIFPEGTWGDRDGKMLPFQRGVIGIARQANVPVVPVTITGSNKVNPPRTKEIHPGAIRMIIHPPLGPDTWKSVSDDEWLGRLRDCIAEGLEHGTAFAGAPGSPLSRADRTNERGSKPRRIAPP